MRLKEIISQNQLANNIFFFNFSVTKKKDDGSTITVQYTIDIPDIYALQYCGERKVNSYLKEYFRDPDKTIPQKYGHLALLLSTVRDSCAYKWAALMDSMQLYYNPLWNVDGQEVTTSVYGQKEITDNLGARSDSTIYGATERTDVHGAQEHTNSYGNDSPYSEVTEYGQDQTQNAAGARTGSSTHKSLPYDDSDTSYSTDITETQSEAVTDTVTRSTHTDTVTHNPHTDKETHATYTDISSDIAHTDQQSKGAQENKRTEATYTDTITHDRHGNIGVTKSTELLRDYRELQIDLYPVILNDCLRVISKGY